MHELESTLQRFSQIIFGTFLITVGSMLQKHAPLKKRYAWANQAQFINNIIHKGKMRRTHSRNKFMDSETDADRIIYNKNVTIVLV